MVKLTLVFKTSRHRALDWNLNLHQSENKVNLGKI